MIFTWQNVVLLANSLFTLCFGTLFLVGEATVHKNFIAFIGLILFGIVGLLLTIERIRNKKQKDNNDKDGK